MGRSSVCLTLTCIRIKRLSETIMDTQLMIWQHDDVAVGFCFLKQKEKESMVSIYYRYQPIAGRGQNYQLLDTPRQ